MGCASKNINTIDVSRATLENPLHIPLHNQNSKVSIISKNTTHAKEDIDDLLLALLQSEHGMRLAQSPAQADFTIYLDIENFAKVNVGTLLARGKQGVWQMTVDVQINDNKDENFTTRITAQAQGENMDAVKAAQALENEVAWTIVRAFNKNY